MTRLKSKTGCLTCIARKKKCDEATPVCGHCSRLHLTCVRRNSGRSSTTAISLTNIRSKPTIRAPISPGHPPFQNDQEREVSIRSPRILERLISRIADPSFQEVHIFARLCIQSPLVRDAVMAFEAYDKGSEIGSLGSYQSCIFRMQHGSVFSSEPPELAMTAVLFLGLLEVS